MTSAWDKAEEAAGLRARDDESFTDLAKRAGSGPDITTPVRQRTEPSPTGDVPLTEELPERVDLTESRYYIGMWGNWGRMVVTYHPGGYVTGAARDPRAVLTGGPTDLYPVSREIALAFQDDGLDDDGDEDDD